MSRVRFTIQIGREQKSVSMPVDALTVADLRAACGHNIASTVLVDGKPRQGLDELSIIGLNPNSSVHCWLLYDASQIPESAR